MSLSLQHRLGRVMATPFCPTIMDVPQQLAPHDVKDGCGALVVRSTTRVAVQCEEEEEKVRKLPKKEAFGGSSLMIDRSLKTKLDVYLFPECDDEKLAHHFMVDRDSGDNVSKTLKRILLKAKSKLSSTEKQKPGSKRQPFHADAFLPEILVDSAEGTSALDVSAMSNAELCRQALVQPLCLRMTIPVESTTIIVEEGHQSPAAPSSVTYLLPIESYPPTIVQVETFQSFKACLFPGVPIVVRVAMLYATSSKVEWFVAGSLVATTVAANLHSFTPAQSHLGQKIELVVTPLRNEVFALDDLALDVHDGLGCELAFRFSQAVAPLPTNAILGARQGWLSAPKDPRDVRVLTYNILADQNAFSRTDRNRSFYPYVAEEILHRERRLPLILHEILAYQADVVCLQEVDEFAYTSLLQPALESRNYQGFYSGKDSDGTREGCALFFSLSAFHPVVEDQLETIIIRDIWASQTGDDNASDDDDSIGKLRHLFRSRPDVRSVMLEVLGHVVQVVPIQHRSSRELIWVANTHLFYHPVAAHLRLLQTYLFSRVLGDRLDASPGSLIVAGDLNASLHDPALQLLMERRVPENVQSTKRHLNTFRWDTTDTTVLPEYDFPALTLPKSFPSLVPAIHPEPQFTHYIDGFIKSLDHILISASALTCIGFAPMPSEALVTANTAMPSAELPSDHVSLVCDVRLGAA